MRRILVAVLAVALFAGCGGDSSSDTPAAEGISGVWTGSYTHANTAEPHALNWQLTQSGTTVTGYEIGASSWRTIEGTIIGNDVTLAIDHGDHYVLILSDDGTTLSGTGHLGEGAITAALTRS